MALRPHPPIIRVAIVHAIEAAPQSFWRIDVAPPLVTRLSGRHGRSLESLGSRLHGDEEFRLELFSSSSFDLN
jgi:hypothetical protein